MTKSQTPEEKIIGRVIEIPIDLIDIGENIRNADEDDENSLLLLGDSIKAEGQIEPCIVYQSGNRYVLKAGSRRYKACVLSNIGVLKCIIDKKFKDEKERIIYQATENEHRDNMNPREREKYMARLLELGMSQIEIAKALHKNRGWVSEALTAYKILANNKALSNIITEDISTRDIWNAGKLSNEELTEVTNTIKKLGVSKKLFKEEIYKKLETKKEKIEEQDLNSQINRLFGIDTEKDKATNSNSEEYKLELHFAFKINEKLKKVVFTGDIAKLDSNIEKYTLNQIKNFYLNKGYTID